MKAPMPHRYSTNEQDRRWRSVRAPLAAIAVLLLGVGCSAITNFDDECTIDADCGSPGLVCEQNLCVAGQVTSDPPKTAFLYIGPVGDYGWTRTHDDGRQDLEAAIPGIETTFAPSVIPPDAPAKIDEFIADGAEVVVVTSFDYIGAVQAAAVDNPAVKFLFCSGFISGANLGSYFGRMYQVKWLAGRLAGHITTSGKIGYVSSILIPETVRHVNAFALGVQSVNPNAIVMVDFIGAWFDPTAEAAAANAMMDAGVDVITNGTDTPQTIQEADLRRNADGSPAVWSIGYDNPNTCELFAPESCVASAYYNWGPVLERQIRAIMDGTWDPSELIWDAMDGAPENSIVHLEWGELSLVDLSVRLDVEGFFGQTDVFGGTVIDDAGQPRSGLRDGDLLSMCWLVDGVVATGDGPPYALYDMSGCVGGE